MHVFHGFQTLLGYRPENRLEDDGNQNNGNTIILKNSVKEIKQKESWLGNHIKPAEVHCLIQIRAHRL